MRSRNPIQRHYPPGVAIRRDTAGRIDAKRRTPQGGLRVDANLTRTGIFTYYNTDGTKVRELRPPEEVFHADSLESLKLAPVTIGHPGIVKSDNYKAHAIGVVAENVRQRGDAGFVAADVLIQDETAIKKIDRGDLVEISCGYEVDLDHTPGEWEGERYDAVQRNIRYNHVGLGPNNWGRAGSEVRLHLDSAGNAVAVEGDADAYSAAMLTQERFDALTAERDVLKSSLDTANAELERVKAELSEAVSTRKDLIDPAKVAELVRARVQLESSARAVLGTSWTPTTSTKNDAGEEVSKDMTDREIMIATISKADASITLEGRSDEYVRATFDLLTARAAKADAALAAVQSSTTAPIKEEPAPSILDKARADRDAALVLASKAGAPAGALTKSAR